MTAHKKAFELFNKMYKYQLDKRSPISWELAKKQALTCVDEILSEVESYNDCDSTIVRNGMVTSVVQRMIYWNEVKSEIEKL